MRTWLIHKLKGFANVEDFLENIRKLETKEKYRILDVAIKRLFNHVSEDEILHQTETGEWMFEGRPMVKGEYENVVEQARRLKDSFLFRVLDKDVKYQSYKKMREATTLFQLESAKMLEYIWDILKTRIKRM